MPKQSGTITLKKIILPTKLSRVIKIHIALTCLYLLCCNLCIIITVDMHEYTINKAPYNTVTAVGMQGS